MLNYVPLRVSRICRNQLGPVGLLATRKWATSVDSLPSTGMKDPVLKLQHFCVQGHPGIFFLHYERLLPSVENYYESET